MKKFFSIIFMVLCICTGLTLFGCSKNTTYNIYISSPTGAEISCSVSSAKANQNIELSLGLSKGYELVYYTINEEPIVGSSFKMPKSDVYVSALVQLINYSINYNLPEDAVNNDYNPQTYTVENATFKLENPTRPGYDFLGWYQDSQFNHQITHVTYGSTGDINIYPRWSLTNYSINYYDGQTKLDMSPANYQFNQVEITLPKASKDGYEFLGWYENPDFSGEKIETINPKTCKNYNLYANFLCTTIDSEGYRLITSETDFKNLQKDTSLWSAKLRLTSDLSLQNPLSIGTEDLPFSGEFDGGNHHFTFSKSDSKFSGLFGVINNANIYSLSLSVLSSNIECEHFGAVACKDMGNSTITDCQIQISNLTLSSTSFLYFGGVVAEANQTNIENCTVQTADISITSLRNLFFGGISGYGGQIFNCSHTSQGQIVLSSKGENSYAYAGGLVGYLSMEGTLQKSFFMQLSSLKLTLEAENSRGYLSGITAMAVSSSVSNCYANLKSLLGQANENSTLYASGLCAQTQNSSFTSCYVLCSSNNAIEAQGQRVYAGFGFANLISSQIRLCLADSELMVSINGQNLSIENSVDAQNITLAEKQEIESAIENIGF